MSTATGVPFPMLCRAARLPEPVGEYKFALLQGRNWRFDWAWPKYRVALEVEGGLFAPIKGRHAQAAGIRSDMEKYNAAQILGWTLLRCLPEELRSAKTHELIRRAIDARRPPL